MVQLSSKISAAVLLAVLRLIAGLLPLKIYKQLDEWCQKGVTTNEKTKSRKYRFDAFLSTSLCFGAGLLLSTCFIHMIPDVRESIDKATKSGHWSILEQFPFSEVVICLGFFAIYLLEELGQICIHRLNAKQPEIKPEEVNERSSTQVLSIPVNDTGQSLNITMEMEEHGTSSSIEENSHENQAIPEADFKLPKIYSFATAVRGLILVVALCFHSIFEGMAIGLQTSTKDVWFLFIAVLLHELAIMFCIGLEMLVAKLQTAIYVVYMVILGLITPIGVVIGILVTEYIKNPSPRHVLTIGILQGIASGALLYVTFLEILERERAKKNINGLIKFTAFFIGFVLLLLVDGLDNGNSKADNRNNVSGLNQLHNDSFRTLWDTSTFPSRPITQFGL